MPIVFAAITPHAPVLIPEIGKDNFKKLAKTEAALQKLEQDLYAAKPESLVVISPHGSILPDAFNINLNTEYSISFKEFGDFAIETKFKSDYMSIQEIRASDETSKDVPIILSSQAELDHGVGVPLYYLARHLKDIPIIPITYSALGLESHFAFGQFLNRQLSRLDKRFAVIASGDLSHRLTKDAPGGYSKQGAEFDKKFVGLVKKGDVKEILKLDSKLIKEAGECGLRSVAILFGAIEPFNIAPEILSYEGPFGVGYLVADLKLS